MKNNWVLRIPKPNWYSMLICFVWAEDVLAEYVRAVLMRLPVVGINNGYVVMTAIYVFAILLALPNLWRYMNQPAVLFPFIFLLIYMVTYLVFPDNASYLDQQLATFLFTVLPLFLIGLAWDSERTANILYYTSLVTVVCMMVYSLFLGDAMGTEQSQYGGSMDRAYKLLPHLCLVGYRAFVKTNPLNVVVTVLGTFLMLSLGTRGALVCFLVFLVMIMLFFGRTKRRVAIISVSAVAVMILSMEQIQLVVLVALEQLLAQLGMSVRIVNMYREGAFFESAGRDSIRESLFEAMSGQGFWGHGLFGDRVIAGQYAHNLVLELIVEFGVILGIILTILIAYVIIRKYRAYTRKDQKAFLLLLVCSAILHLMLSGSYLNEPLFFLLLGVCLSRKNEGLSSIDGSRHLPNI